MSIIGSRPNSLTVYRASENNAVLHKNMYHLRDNSGNRTFTQIQPRKVSPRRFGVDPFTRRGKQQVAERIMNMRFPDISKYDGKVKGAKVVGEERKRSIRLERGVESGSGGDEERKRGQQRMQGEDVNVSVQKKRMNDLSQANDGKSQRNPKSHHTVSQIRSDHIFSPVNPNQARKMIERNVFLNNTKDINFDLPEKNPSESDFFDHDSIDKAPKLKFVPNNKNPSHIRNASGYMNSNNNFETFLKRNDEAPRLAILENYKQISRVMRNTFLKAKDLEQRFKNNALTSEELRKKKEEEENTKKLTKILKQMNSPRNAFSTMENNLGAL
ncbi:unnamed protein product [Moneuplotes crassus]|uniref:Uncharacterized protein n=1 Tax=Euplotes crassus TaxID=5936 RepID=A0AAD2CYT3_EUPCR|nr:unnamed protein product [Moneuplotes crassus]